MTVAALHTTAVHPAESSVQLFVPERFDSLHRTGSDRPAAPAATSHDPATRFRQALVALPPDPVRPLPHHLAPLAAAVAGRRPVRIATGPSSRHALRMARSRAATADGVIHLPTAPDRSRDTAALIAHELVHVAAGGRRPRFHGDRHLDHEERTARQVGDAVRRRGATPLAVSVQRRTKDPNGPTGTAGLAVGSGGGFLQALSAAPPDVTVTVPQAGRRPGTPPAIVTRRAGSSVTPGTAAAIQRRIGVVPPVSSNGGRRGDDVGSSGPEAGTGPSRTDGSAPPVPGSTPVTTDTSAAPGIGADVDMVNRIVDALEARVLAELERRGLRRPGVF